MASSGTTNFAPSIGELVLYAYGLCGIRRTEILQQHLADARMATNLLLADWDNDTPNLWKVSETVQTLVEGVATYDVDPSVVTILDVFVRLNPGQEDQYDRIIWPISRTEYASMPDKTIQAPPTVFWFDRLLAPTITLWQVPPATGVAELHYYQVSQIFDANLPNGETIDLPVIWLPAFAYGLAELLSDTYAPTRTDRLAAKAATYLAKARQQNVETSNTLYFAPALTGYYTR